VKFILLVFASAPVPSHSIALGEGNDKQRPLCCYPTGSDEGKQGEIWKSSLLKYTKAKAPMICKQISHRKCKRKFFARGPPPPPPFARGSGPSIRPMLLWCLPRRGGSISHPPIRHALRRPAA
jgi:hypothetical protein